MALTDSSMLALGTKMPEFDILNTIDGRLLSSTNLNNSKAYLVLFICNHCPYVIHIIPEILRISNDYKKEGLQLICISSNDAINYPMDAPLKMKQMAEHFGFDFPYLYDESQEVAKSFKAECTPDNYLFDQNKKLIYRGRIDESRPSNSKPLNGKDIRNAIEIYLRGMEIPTEQYPSAGCNIKWKS